MSNTRDIDEPYGKELLTASEVAKFLRVNVRRVNAWGNKGWLTQCRANGKVKFLGVEVTALRDQMNKPHDEW